MLLVVPAQGVAHLKGKEDRGAEIEHLNEVVNLNIGKMLGSAKQAWAAWDRLEELGAIGGEG